MSLTNSTETSVSGMSPKLPICLEVSEYVNWRMTLLDVNSCYCVIGVFSRGFGSMVTM
jgi:hypothetical protein